MLKREHDEVSVACRCVLFAINQRQIKQGDDGDLKLCQLILCAINWQRKVQLSNDDVGHNDDGDDDVQVRAVCHQPAAGNQAEPPPPAVHRGDKSAGSGVEQHAPGQKTGDPLPLRMALLSHRYGGGKDRRLC